MVAEEHEQYAGSYEERVITTETTERRCRHHLPNIFERLGSAEKKPKKKLFRIDAKESGSKEV